MLMISDFMIVYVKVMQRQCGSIFMHHSNTRTSLPVFLKIMMSRVPPQLLIRKITKLQQSSHSYHPGYDFFTRGNLQEEKKEYLHTWSVLQRNPSILICKNFMKYFST